MTPAFALWALPGACRAQETGQPSGASSAAKLAIAGLAAVDCAGNPVDAEGKPITAANPKPDGVPEIRLNGRLAVFLTGGAGTLINPTEATLALNNRAIHALQGTVYLANLRALVFRLTRNSDNSADWGPLLGSPGWDARPIEVGIWLEPPKDATPTQPITRAEGVEPSLKLALLPGGWLFLAFVAVAAVIVAVLAAAKRTNLLRDSLLPQLPQREQTYSLGRSQMAFWFVIIFGSYLFLYVLLHDYNTLTTQSLVLMGFSAGTAVFAVALDKSKETPIGKANEDLRAIGLNSYEDVTRLENEITQRNNQLQTVSDSTTRLKLQTEITDRQAKLRTWREKTAPYKSQGWWKDVTTDLNGPTLHRVQIVFWSIALGWIFLVQVYQTLTMPSFSDTLLGLMGVTSAGYLGFKYPEQQG
jgi:hypothetical protein